MPLRKSHIPLALTSKMFFAFAAFFHFVQATACPQNSGAIQKDSQDKPAYQSAAALFKKYCNSCHNASDNEGGLSLTSPEELAKGGENGPAILAGNAKDSRLVRMINGSLEPKMPPDDMAGPSKEELDALMAWIDDGAKVDANYSVRPQKLTVPDVEAQVSTDPITDLTWSPDGKKIAVARYQRIDILDGKSKKMLYQLKEHPGKVNSISFSNDSNYLLAATGVTGLKGVAIEWDLGKKEIARRYEGHADVIYSAVFSPDSATVATAGYDRKILLWSRRPNESEPKIKHKLIGHNDAVYSLQFSPSGKVLASASGDQTVKLWNTLDGHRLDTLGQPLKEQFVTRFHPKGNTVIGAGRDNRIRLWKLKSIDKPAINPIAISRFAHEASIVALSFSKDGKVLVSAAEDKTIKIWSGEGVELLSSLPKQKDVVFGLAISPSNELAVGRMDGSLDFYSLGGLQGRSETAARELDHLMSAKRNSLADAEVKKVDEIEPNSSVADAQVIELPADIKGKILKPANVSVGGESTDVDLYRIRVKKGDMWVIETNAAQSKSQADTKIEVLDVAGNPVRRAKLQAIRDSYFTFRGKDANTSDDFRVHNWEEMELNEFLYCNGEVVRLFLYPRGPDSGFQVYPGYGSRHNFLDTTPVAHALQEPCYIVKAYPPNAKPKPNGLPTFDLFYENDDDPKRKLGSDSKLFFTAPREGEFLVKVTDSRGFQGEKYDYRLIIRSPKPDFNVSFSGKKMKLKRGSGREFGLTASRIDNFNGPIDVLFENVPPGIQLPKRLTIQQNHFRAFGTFHASADAEQPTPEQIKNIKVSAVAKINGNLIRKDLGKIEELKLEDSPKIQTRIVPAYNKLSSDERNRIFEDAGSEPVELTIRAGTTISASLVVKRNKHGGDIDFGNADSGRNLPHGVFVDNIGLNGLRIIKGQGDVREVFITAAKWVPEQTRLFHLKAKNVEGETTVPVLLKVIKP